MPMAMLTNTPSCNYAGGSVMSFRDWTYDAAGRMSQVKETVTANNSVSIYVSSHDGDGQPTSNTPRRIRRQSHSW
jgi:hypothetical protein